MNDPSLVFDDGTAVVANFAMHAGREATPAEIDRLGDALLELVDAAEIVCETRTEVDRQRRATVYQVRVEPPAGAPREAVAEAVEAWAQECIAERRLMTP